MKIAMITPGFLPVPALNGGAVEVLIQRLLEGNEEYRNHEIDVFTINNPNIRNDLYKYSNIVKVNIDKKTKIKNFLVNNIYKLLHIKKWRTSYSRQVAKMLGKKKYDIIVVHNNLIAYRDIHEKTVNKSNLIYVLHNDINKEDINHVIIAELIARTAKKVLAVSNYTKEAFERLTGASNVDVLYNCIKLSDYTKPLEREKLAHIKIKYLGTNKDFVFMYSGRIDIYKGVLELVKAFKSLSYDNVKLVIVGKSWFDEKDRLDTYTEMLKKESESIAEKIIFTGFIGADEMPYMYQLANCLVIPSVWEEPFGVVALEGMASKLPMIVTNSGGLMEIVDSDCAYIVNKESNMEQNLAEAMEEVLKNRKLAKEKGQNGYDKLCKTEDFSDTNYYKIFCRKLGI